MIGVSPAPTFQRLGGGRGERFFVLSDRITLGVEIPEADCAGPVTLDDVVACLVKKLRIGP